MNDTPLDHFAERSKHGAPPDGGDPWNEGQKVLPNFRSLADFCGEFRPISYAVASLMREGSLYTLTGRTGEGKTAFLVILGLAIATGLGEKLIGRKVKKGRVAFCTAENPDDLRMRLMIACFVFNIDPAIIDRDMLISDNRVAPEDIVWWIKETGEAFTLIVVDTWQAYFDGRDPNNNAEAVSFTRRFRPLAAGKGQPIVLIAAHPPKQANNDNLLPYGGGGTLNEVDGNFTLRLDENGLCRFHWLGKIRGLPFDPLHFRIDKLDSPDVVTVEEARVKMPVMFPVGDEAVEEREETFAKLNLALLKAMAADPTGSERKWTAAVGISRRAAQAALCALKRDRLVTQKLKRWRLTTEGERIAKEGEKAPEKARASGEPGKRKTGRAKTEPSHYPKHPETPMFSGWPAGSARPIGAASQGVFRAGSARVGGILCPHRASKRNHPRQTPGRFPSFRRPLSEGREQLDGWTPTRRFEACRPCPCWISVGRLYPGRADNWPHGRRARRGNGGRPARHRDGQISSRPAP